MTISCTETNCDCCDQFKICKIYDDGKKLCTFCMRKEEKPKSFNGLLNETIGPLMVMTVTAKKIQEDWPEIWYKKGYQDAKAGKPEMDFTELKKKKEATHNSSQD